MFGGHMTKAQVSGCEHILAACGDLSVEFAAYLLATAFHETARTMQPIEEYGRGRGRPYGKPGKYGQAQYGRGYVQLTWDRNYERADRELKMNGRLLKNFDIALQPTVAAHILRRGCVEGWFTKYKLSDFLPGDYVGARRVVNGNDRAVTIAQYAKTFERALRTAGWEKVVTPPPPTKRVSRWQGLYATLVALLRRIFKGG